MSLDLFSITQTKRDEIRVNRTPLPDYGDRDIALQLETAAGLKYERCDNNAPYIFFVDRTGRGRIVQGSCNNWLCDRCGHLRALEEYGRMVTGAKRLDDEGHQLYFLTLTCRGADMPLEEANENYMRWTNTLLTNCRTKHKRAGGHWAYVQVTERQKRGHPHSHIITTFVPHDAALAGKNALLSNGAIAKRECLDSAWLVNACKSAGLGPMVDLTVIENPAAVAVYVAKYLFKDAMQTKWPKHWRRIRYSRSWPKLPAYDCPEAFPLLSYTDWLRMQNLGITVYADDPAIVDMAHARLVTCVVYKRKAVV